MRNVAFLIALPLILLAGPASAAPLPDPEKIALASERPLLGQLSKFITGVESAPATRLQSLDQLLAQLQQPTQLRGLVQFIRAVTLAEAERASDAREAVLESIRLLPENSAPLLLASQIYMYEDQPAQAADYLLRASRLDPRIVDSLDDYEVSGLIRRLGEWNDTPRIDAVSERLLEIGWSGGKLSTVSAMAMSALDARLDRGDVNGAAAMVPKVISPASFAQLLTQKRYEAIRPVAETWAGGGLEKQWRILLEESRSDWEASRDLEAGRRYAQALAQAGHDRTVIATFQPLFGRPIGTEQHDLMFIAPYVASALAREGRWNEAFEIFDKALQVWKPGEHANALNLSANRARLLYFKGDFQAAAAAFDRALVDARKWGGQVNSGALAAMHLYRACTLEQLGRAGDAITSAAFVTGRRAINPNDFVYLRLCANDIPGARRAMLDAIGDGATRAASLAQMQPSDERSFDSEFARTMKARREQLRADPELLAAARKHATILTRPINASAPAETVSQTR